MTFARLLTNIKQIPKEVVKMEMEAFLKCIRNYEIPPEAPDVCKRHARSHFTSIYEAYGGSSRTLCTHRGMWVLVTQDLAKRLAEFIGKRKVLEIMSGVGWLAKALSEQGIDVKATDDYSWSAFKENGVTKCKNYEGFTFLYDVEKIDCRDAIGLNRDDYDILLVAWPHMSATNVLVEALDLWGEDKPIIYIGEGVGGCCAEEEFWKVFKSSESAPEIYVEQWPGLHDGSWIGYYKPLEI